MDQMLSYCSAIQLKIIKKIWNVRVSPISLQTGLGSLIMIE